MKIIHIIYNEWTKGQVKKLLSYGIKVEEGYDRFDIEEGDLYFSLKHLFAKWAVAESFGTIYNSKDVNESKLLVYVSTWVNGYPQPAETDEYLELTYDLTDYCNVCGIGAKQDAPFRIKKQPKWGNKKLFELEWIFDEIFVRRDVYESVFMPLGIEAIPVLLYKKDTEIDDTVQLKIPKIDIANRLALENQPYSICENCGRKKYIHKIKGYVPGFTSDIGSLQIFKCNEVFGEQLLAHNKIFITSDLLKNLHSHKIKPNVWPVR